VADQQPAVDRLVQRVDGYVHVQVGGQLAALHSPAQHFGRTGPPGCDQPLVQRIGQHGIVLAFRQQPETACRTPAR
jgi:hypothetical protein